MMQTTLNKIKSHSPCGLQEPNNTQKGWGKLLNHLGKTQSDDEPLELSTILESNGVDDTIWAMRAVDVKDKDIRLFAADCAELVLPIYEKQYPNDDRPRKAIQAARDYANRLINEDELAAASAAASAAAGAAWAARATASAAWAAAWAASAAWAAWAARSARSAAASAAAAANASAEIEKILIKYIWKTTKRKPFFCKPS